ncbi:hypothetical protein PoB_004090000 [Plakobranchus ocellatus]|uniref:Uncharacterized protein n=1 Tax=Plakobranchus ocellatus TaxID=259542 RepID=A0AAV4B1D3_9GAST|nr:hypothetical protein PoB_004090000 [Plakobranchus ocellatus]
MSAKNLVVLHLYFTPNPFIPIDRVYVAPPGKLSATLHIDRVYVAPPGKLSATLHILFMFIPVLSEVCMQSPSYNQSVVSLSFLYIASPQQGDLRLSGPPSGQGTGSGARTRDRRVPADLRADPQATVLPAPPRQ